MTFWDWADKHSADAAMLVLFCTIIIAIAVVRIVAWLSMAAVNFRTAGRKPPLQAAERKRG